MDPHSTAGKVVSTPEGGRERIVATAVACLDAIASNTVTAALVDQLAVRMAHGRLVLSPKAVQIVEEIQDVAERAAAARERIADLGTPTSDVHTWTDQLELCRRQSADLRARLQANV